MELSSLHDFSIHRDHPDPAPCPLCCSLGIPALRWRTGLATSSPGKVISGSYAQSHLYPSVVLHRGFPGAQHPWDILLKGSPLLDSGTPAGDQGTGSSPPPAASSQLRVQPLSAASSGRMLARSQALGELRRHISNNSSRSQSAIQQPSQHLHSCYRACSDAGLRGGDCGPG